MSQATYKNPGTNPSSDPRVQPGTEVIGDLHDDVVPTYESVLERFSGCTVLVDGCPNILKDGKKCAVTDKTSLDTDGMHLWQEDYGRGLSVYSTAAIAFDECADKRYLDGIYKYLVFDNPTEADILADLTKLCEVKPPRLSVTHADVARMKSLVKTDEYAALMFQSAKRAADGMLAKELAADDAAKRAQLTQLRELAIVYAITEERVYLDKLMAILDNAEDVDHWNHECFLDTSSILENVSLVYDLLYDQLDEVRRKSLREQIINKGLLPAKDQLDRNVWWYYRVPYYNNWTAHCVSGIAIGALAVCDHETKALAAHLIHKATVALIDSFLLGSLPDGGWEEGHWYWGFGLTPLSHMLACLKRALGHTYSLTAMPMMRRAVYYYTNLFGSVGGFNFADSGMMPRSRAIYFWWAEELGDPDMAGVRLAEIVKNSKKERAPFLASPSAEDLMFYKPELCNFELLSGMDPYFKKDSHYRNVEVAMMRTSWDDENAMFVGIKGGLGAANHGHADCGSFVLDADGERWVWELSSDSYSLPRYFDTFGMRYSYYRNMPSGHNTLVFGDPAVNCQDIFARAPLFDVVLNEDVTTASVALGDVYAKFAETATRRFTLDKTKRELMVSDFVRCRGTQDLMWKLHTRAEITLVDEKHATLTVGEKSITVTLSGDGCFVIESACPPEGSLHAELQNKNEAFRCLVIRCTKIETARFDVTFRA